MRELEQLVAEIQPTLEKIEADRLDYHRRKDRWIMVVAVPIMLVAGLIALFLFPFGLIALGVGGAGIYFSYRSMVLSYADKYVSAYKSIVIARVVAFFDSNLSFSEERGIGCSAFQRTELFKRKISRYHTEDLIAGSFGGIRIAFAEVHAEELQSTGKSAYYVDIFKGLLLIADFHKHFKGRTFVFPDVAERNLGKLGRGLQKLGGRSGTSLVHMEDAEFERAYAVHSTDQIEARYLLSPAMMRRLLDLRNRFGNDVRLSFRESSVCIAVPRHSPYLEPCPSIPANDPRQVKNMAKTIAMLLAIVEELDLNTRIWTKE